MDYETAVQTFFQPTPAGTDGPLPIGRPGPARKLRDACEPLATHAIWSRLTNERLAKLGLNFLTGYVWGRAAALGEPPASLVVAAFAAFEPGLITSLYEEARRQVSRDELLAARDEATIESLQRILGDSDVTFAVTALRRGLEAADGTGRPLFAGLQSRPWPDSPVGQLWRACDLIREHRGDSHITVYTVSEYTPLAMNILTELYIGMPLGTYTATRGWSQEAIAAAAKQLEAAKLMGDEVLNGSGIHLRERIEDLTDRLEQPIITAIGADLTKLVHQLNHWSAACIKAGAFPPNVYKRAAG